MIDRDLRDIEKEVGLLTAQMFKKAFDEKRRENVRLKRAIRGLIKHFNWRVKDWRGRHILVKQLTDELIVELFSK